MAGFGRFAAGPENGPVPSAPPPGDPAPDDGALPGSALAGLGARTLSFYVHVPFCTVRCGYCDFNTYTAEELGSGASRSTYAEQAIAEVRLARRVLGDADLPVSTVFFGGGTPTLLSPADLGAVVAAVAAEFGLAPDAEVTAESNPDSVALWDLEELRAVGFNRMSFGMQSAVDHVLRTLDRTHDPLRVPHVVDWARRAGFEQVSLDLIYGTPGESLADWEASVEAALACRPEHVSAYSLIVEEGTALARRVRRGELPMPDDDDLADKYLLVDERLHAAGLAWYEVSNWGRSDAARCRHNLAYWRGGDWWGVGPGAHSHVGGTRWWNVRHPAAYAERLTAGRSPAHAREVLAAEDRRVERVLLEVRLAEGLPLDVLDDAGRAAVPDVVAEGLAVVDADRLVLTQRGRLLADAVVRRLT
jgi:oxygen-independent coproporphyrinogen-3 oxidase